jgi:hypothetical protein
MWRIEPADAIVKSVGAMKLLEGYMGSLKIIREVLTAQPVHTANQLFNTSKKLSDQAGMYTRVVFLAGLVVFMTRSLDKHGPVPTALIVIAMGFFSALAFILLIVATLAVFQSLREKIMHGYENSPPKKQAFFLRIMLVWANAIFCVVLALGIALVVYDAISLNTK